jgi:hypothetical protein
MSPADLKMQPTIHLEIKPGYFPRSYPGLLSKCIVGCISNPSDSLSLVNTLHNNFSILLRRNMKTENFCNKLYKKYDLKCFF